MIDDGYYDLPAGKLAAVVTYLEMTERPMWIDGPAEGELRRVVSLEPDAYRRLFRAVGENWLWFSRLAMPDVELTARLARPGVEVYEFDWGEAKGVGLLELERGNGVEISLFGLLPGWTGKGYGTAMMTHALRRAWTPETARVWLHTCTLDHPRALRFYRKAGFRPYARALEIATDPRVRGVLPESAAPEVPLIKPAAGVETPE